MSKVFLTERGSSVCRGESIFKYTINRSFKFCFRGLYIPFKDTEVAAHNLKVDKFRNEVFTQQVENILYLK